MKKGFIFVTSALLALGLASCNNPAPESSQPTASSVNSTAKSTSSAAETSQGPKKELTNVSISLGKDGGFSMKEPAPLIMAKKDQPTLTTPL